jgi:hypothetical protein
MALRRVLDDHRAIRRVKPPPASQDFARSVKRAYAEPTMKRTTVRRSRCRVPRLLLLELDVGPQDVAVVLPLRVHPDFEIGVALKASECRVLRISNSKDALLCGPVRILLKSTPHFLRHFRNRGFKRRTPHLSPLSLKERLKAMYRGGSIPRPGFASATCTPMCHSTS